MSLAPRMEYGTVWSKEQSDNKQETRLCVRLRAGLRFFKWLVSQHSVRSRVDALVFTGLG